MEARELKGLEIAAKSKLTRRGNMWLVPSQSGIQERYSVALHQEKPECTCRDYEFTNEKCKHIFAVEYTIEREQTADGQTGAPDRTDYELYQILEAIEEVLSNPKKPDKQ